MMVPAYSIDGLCPDGGMGGYGFNIHLSPSFKEAVLVSKIDQDSADRVLSLYGLEWLQKCGFNAYFDPENSGWKSDRRQIPSNEAKPSPGRLSVSWGEWGPEHITVPGNACGLDIDRSSAFCVFDDGRILVPHNVDHWGQVNLLLIVFTWFAYSLTLDAACRNHSIV